MEITWITNPRRHVACSGQVLHIFVWLREDGTPYYVGKGTGNRAIRKGSPKDLASILIQEFPSEADAFAAEKFLIAYYGRIDLGTGCLRNRTDGDDGASGRLVSQQTRLKQRTAHKGKTLSEEHCRNISKSKQGHETSEETCRKIKEAAKGNTNSRIGSKHHCSKLTDAKVREIRERYATSECTHRLLAKQFAVRPCVIWDAVNRKTWKHVQ
jgi:hypothetical protein